MPNEKKCIYTLNIDNYSPEITALTYPYLENYAKRIGADFRVITKRNFPEWPLTYEKLQIYRITQSDKNDWSIYVDSDCLIHPDTPDFTLYMTKDTVAHFNCDMAGIRWRYDRFFQRDGRNIGSANWFAIASDWCLDLWKPLDDLTPDQAIANIRPTQIELAHGITAEHLIDDYALSRNIARYGLKFTTISKLLERIGMPGVSFFHHQYTATEAEKVVQIAKAKEIWACLAKGEQIPAKP